MVVTNQPESRNVPAETSLSVNKLYIQVSEIQPTKISGSQINLQWVQK